MGSPRPRPVRLAEKLLAIREALNGGLSQSEMIRHLGLDDLMDRERISKYERNIIEPPLPVLCAYADAANVWLDVLVRDELDLPEKFPGIEKSEGLRRK